MNPNDVFTHAMQVYQTYEEPERLYALAGKYWRVMLTAGVFVCILAVAAGAYMLVMTFVDMTINRSQAAAPETLNRTELSKVVAGLSARQTLFSEIKIATIVVEDPSK